jgi:LuxR family maltose regulon positive regulatory protein
MAADLFRQTLDMAARQGWLRLPMVSLPYVWLGKLLYEWNDLDAATQHVLAGIRLIGPQEQARVLLEGHATLALIKQAQGDVTGAVDMLRQAEQVAHATTMPWAGPLLGTYQARLWLAQGQVERAGRWIQEAGLHVDDEASAQRELGQVMLARVLIAQGKPAGALSLLERLAPAAEAAGRLRSTSEILMLQAMALHARGDSAQAMQVLRRTLALAEPEGYVRLFVDEGLPMAALLRQARAHGIAPAYASKLLAAFADTTNDEGRTANASPSSFMVRPSSLYVEPLSYRELEVLRLIAAGFTNQQIAQQLVLAVSTVKRHLSNIYGKLTVQSRTQAVARARELDLL